MFRMWSRVWRFACAAAAPDLPYFVLLGYYSPRLHVNGFADLGAWDSAWRCPVVCLLHSFAPWAGWLSHIVIDTLTHRSNGYPIVYPLLAYRFSTPVSYWNRRTTGERSC